MTVGGADVPCHHEEATHTQMIAPPPRTPRHVDVVSDTGQEQRPVARALTLIASFRYAFAGVRYLLWSQRNAKIHGAISLIAVTLGFMLRIERGEWLALTLVIAMVFVAEGFNTAIEAVVDLASPDYHPLAKIAKDVGAGAVLLTAIAAVIVGLIVFVPHLLLVLEHVLGL